MFDSPSGATFLRPIKKNIELLTLSTSLEELNLIIIKTMGCGNSQQSVSTRPGQGQLLIWGDYFSPETRTIIAMLMITGIKFELELVDQFKGENKTP